jgi:hypothetical protein
MHGARCGVGPRWLRGPGRCRRLHRHRLRTRLYMGEEKRHCEGDEV